MTTTIGLTLEQKKLVEDNHSLIYGFAKMKGLNFDEFYDILAIGLCKAALIFDSIKGSFSTLAYRSMENELYSYYKHQNNKSAIPQDKILYHCTDKEHKGTESNCIYLDGMTDGTSLEEMAEASQRVCEFVAELPERDRVLLRCLLQGLRQNEIAELFDVSRQRVSQLVKNLQRKAALFFF